MELVEAADDQEDHFKIWDYWDPNNFSIIPTYNINQDSFMISTTAHHHHPLEFALNHDFMMQPSWWESEEMQHSCVINPASELDEMFNHGSKNSGGGYLLQDVVDDWKNRSCNISNSKRRRRIRRRRRRVLSFPSADFYSSLHSTDVDTNIFQQSIMSETDDELWSEESEPAAAADQELKWLISSDTTKSNPPSCCCCNTTTGGSELMQVEKAKTKDSKEEEEEDGVVSNSMKKDNMDSTTTTSGYDHIALNASSKEEVSTTTSTTCTWRASKIISISEEEMDMEEERKKMVLRVAYPFTVVKPSGVQGDVTLTEINKRILKRPTRPIHHPVGVFARRPNYLQSAIKVSGLTGKSVVALTTLQTTGRGSITIIRTRG